MSRSASQAALASGGVFELSLAEFRPRTAQQEMAVEVEDTLRFQGTLVAESGTGTGKTFAYLVPAVLSGKRVVISTGTRHLQDQIFQRDLPTVSRVLEVPVNAVILKGRRNYLCRYRLRQQLQQTELVGRTETRSFRAIEQWAAGTTSGDIAEVADLDESSPLWRQVTSTPENCLGYRCPDFDDCFVFRARERAMKADLVVVNHHLFFSDLTLRNEGFGELLPDRDAVIFDEAHALPEVARLFFGGSVSSAQVQELARDVLMAEQDERSGADLEPGVTAVRDAITAVERSVSKYSGQSVDYDSLVDANFDDGCRELQLALDRLEQGLALAAPAGEGLNRCHDRCLLIQGQLDQWLNDNNRAQIRWAEVGERSVRFISTPLSIRDRFASMMTGAPAAWVFTSATLAVGEDFSAFCQLLGLEEAETRCWPSPFDYRSNTLLLLPGNLPDPRAEQYRDELAVLIERLVEVARGRTFCLFTSHSMMRSVQERLKGRFEWPMLCQGEAPKRELLERFSQLGNAVLLGTASFWEGVDVRGEALSCVIIDKLPFASPSDPVLKRRLEACEEQGGKPFADIQLPEAAIALKQGAGRLIRDEHDRGVLVLCDPRVVSMSYGRVFRDALPPMPVTDSLTAVETFFAHD